MKTTRLFSILGVTFCSVAASGTVLFTSLLPANAGGVQQGQHSENHNGNTNTLTPQQWLEYQQFIKTQQGQSSNNENDISVGGDGAFSPKSQSGASSTLNQHDASVTDIKNGLNGHNENNINAGTTIGDINSGSGPINNSLGQSSKTDVTTGPTRTGDNNLGTNSENNVGVKQGDVNAGDVNLNVTDSSSRETDARSFSRNRTNVTNFGDSNGSTIGDIICIPGSGPKYVKYNIADGKTSTNVGVDAGFLGGFNFGRATAGMIHPSQQELLAEIIISKAESGLARLSRHAHNPVARRIMYTRMERLLTADIRSRGIKGRDGQSLADAAALAKSIVDEMVAQGDTNFSDCVDGTVQVRRTPQRQIKRQPVTRRTPVQRQPVRSQPPAQDNSVVNPPSRTVQSVPVRKQEKPANLF